MDCCSDLKSNSLFNWSDPKFTGLIFGSINIAFILSWTAEMNVFTIFSYLSLFYILSGIIIGKVLTKENPESGDHYEHVTKDQVESFVKCLYKLAIDVDQYMRRVISLSDYALTLKFFAAVITLNTISCWFCESFLIWLGINFLFVWPPVYHMNRDLIDNTFETVKKSTCEYYEIVKSMIPKYQGKN